MADWIAFDEPSAAALTARAGTEAALGTGDPIRVALTANVTSMLALSGSADTVRVLTIRPRPQAPALIQQATANSQ